MNGEKKCPECGSIKPFDSFYPSGATKDGRQAWCKKCKLKYENLLKRRKGIARRDWV